MENLATPRLIISGSSASSGSALISLGLICELKRRGISPSCAVIGPQLQQAVVYRRVLGRLVRCLDDRLLTPGQNLVSTYQSTVGAEVLVIEGANGGGLYDGVGAASLRGSTAEMAGLIHTPVVLVVDPRGLQQSLGALVKGYADAARDFSVSGSVLYRAAIGEGELQSKRESYDTIMQLFGAPPVMGVVPELQTEVSLPVGDFRQDQNRTSLPRQFMLDVASLVSRYVDVDALLGAAQQATPIRISDYQHQPTERRARIAVSDDVCFSLSFQDNLDLLRYYGAEVVTFSPLADAELPRRVGAVYLTGAYLSEYGNEVAANTSMRESLYNFAADGGIVFSEGAGTAYLCKSYRMPGGASADGVGVIPAQAVPQTSRFAYADIVTVDESIAGRAGLIAKGVSTNEWRIAGEEPMVRALRLSVLGNPSVPEGYSPGAQILATFAFFHFGSNPEIAKNLVDAASVVQKM